MEMTQIVVFELKGHEFGVDIKKVIEILNYEEIRPVPEVPAHIEGIINVRGIIYPVINLRRRLSMDLAENEKAGKIILLHLEKNKVGFLVDSVVEILNIDEMEVEQPPQLMDRKKSNCIDCIVKGKDNMIIVLDVNTLISDEDNLFIQGVSNENNCSGYPEQREG